MRGPSFPAAFAPVISKVDGLTGEEECAAVSTTLSEYCYRVSTLC